MDFEYLVTALEPPPNHVGTTATNVFVGVSKPRELLALAPRKSEAMVLMGPAANQGWKFVDLVVQTAEPKE